MGQGAPRALLQRRQGGPRENRRGAGERVAAAESRREHTMMKKLIACLAAGTIAGAAFAKLPPAAPQTDAQKAEKAAKDKASADKDGDLLAKSQDRAAANYK